MTRRWEQKVDAEGAAGNRRTYLRRRGRTTRGQARALETLSSRYCLPTDTAAAPLEPATVFGRDAPLGLEIGFGMGHALVQWAGERPHWNLLGLEVYQPGIGAAMLGLEREGADNVRLLEAPAETVLAHRFADASLDEVRIFFPDPWPKKRHHKRRLLQPAFVSLLRNKLKPGAVLWVATDWEAYGEWMVDVLDREPGLVRERPPLIAAADEAGAAGPESPMSEAGAAGEGRAASERSAASERRAASETAEARPRTRFEARGLRLGHQVWDLRYVRKRSSTESR